MSSRAGVMCFVLAVIASDLLITGVPSFVSATALPGWTIPRPRVRQMVGHADPCQPDAMTQAEKAATFRALHEAEPFVIPNPWDAGAARVLEQLGFKALATTSSGFAFTLGRRDGEVTLDEVLSHTAALAAVTELPVSVALAHGHGPEPAGAARAVA